MSSLPPDGPAPPPGVPPQTPGWSAPRGRGPVVPPVRESRGVAFFVAIFLGILLVASAGLNVLLLLLSVGSLAGAGLGGTDDGGAYDEVHVAGERDARTRILQVPIHGAIAEGQSALLGASGGSVTQVRRALKYAEANDVAGILLHVDSPGGGVTDSDEIYRMLVAFRRDNPAVPIVALFGDMAASGGYYVAAAAEQIFARPTSITGSIGVIMSAWNFTEAARKVGIDQVVIKSDRTPYKDILSPTRPMREDERKMLTDIVDELYDQFVTIVDEGRPAMDRDQVQAVANGAIYTASQALAHGLIDAIGDHQAVADYFEKKLGKQPIAIVERRRRAGLGDLLFGARTQPPTVEQSLGAMLTATSGPRFLYYWEGGR